MENNQNEFEKDLKHEKLKLHYKYLIVIAIIILFAGIVLATSNQNEFVSQVSFGSTISSIILSVIAIWMSISGERTTNDIRIKIAESSERLLGTTKELEILNENQKETMETQLSELTNVQEQLTKIIHSINNVEKQVSSIYENNTNNPNIINNNTMDTNQRMALFHNIYSWVANNNPYGESLFCHMLFINIQSIKENNICYYNYMINYLINNNININQWMKAIDINWGIINTLSSSALFYDENAINNILQIITPKIQPWNPVV